jgi:hypothetical protein
VLMLLRLRPDGGRPAHATMRPLGLRRGSWGGGISNVTEDGEGSY